MQKDSVLQAKTMQLSMYIIDWEHPKTLYNCSGACIFVFS